MSFRDKVLSSYTVLADYLTDIPKLSYKPASSETWQAIQHAKLDKSFGVPSRDSWQEADLPIGQVEKSMLKCADTDIIERFGYISNLISSKYPKQYADIVDYRNGKVVIVKPVTADVEITPKLMQKIIDWLSAQFNRAKVINKEFRLEEASTRYVESTFGITISKFVDAFNQELMKSVPRVNYPIGFLSEFTSSFPKTERGAEMSDRFTKGIENRFSRK